MSEKVWRGRLGDFPAFSTPDDFGEQDQVVLSHAADYDALKARVVEIDEAYKEHIKISEKQHERILTLESERKRDAVDGQNALDEANERIATLEAELAYKTEECEAGLELSGSFFEALKSLNLKSINVANPGAHVTALIVERDTALAELATAREECERLRGLLRRVLLALIPDKALASDQQKKLVVESASTILDDVRKELKI